MRLTVWLEPIEIPGGWWAGFEDPHGDAVYVLDRSNANEASPSLSRRRIGCD